ncbi:hypothetical protein BC834DRAFT_1043899 [Gloeopeniophorella convolvens]|nr:hypothetical protein BC834DRAFT_1043899 [Gloeopeniophorella convolvens]
MTTAALANGLHRVSLALAARALWPSPASRLKAFSTAMTTDSDETPAMKALRDIPYPSAAPDPAIFEDWSGEYAAIKVTQDGHGVRRPGKRALQPITDSRDGSATLEQMSLNGELDDAETIRKEMVDLKIPIRPSFNYYRAAWYVLRLRPWPEDRAERFANWLTLLPDKTLKPPMDHFHEIKTALFFTEGAPDLKSVSHFGVILAKKGYIRNMGASAIGFLARYAHPEVTLRVLEQMLAADREHKSHEAHRWYKKRFNETAKHMWSIVVRTHCNCHRPEAAFRTAKHVRARGETLTRFTFQYLLGKLHSDGLHDMEAEVRSWPGIGELPDAKSRLRTADPASLKDIPAISPRHSPHVNLGLALSHLKRSERLRTTPRASELVPFLDIYKRSLRGARLLNALRSRAYRLSYRAASVVVLAELLHHHRRGQFRHVLWVFDKFLHRAGVPAPELARALWRRPEYPSAQRLHARALPRRITRTTLNLPSKLWPTQHHTALACLPRSTRTSSPRRRRAPPARPRRRPTLRPSPSPSIPIHPYSPAALERYDSAHFLPFFVARTLLRGPDAGLRVLDDMLDRGVPLDAAMLGVGAALHARHGAPATALRMLGALRTPALAAYTAALRGLLDRRALADARALAARIEGELAYAPGSNRQTDAALAFLARLEADPRAAPPAPREPAAVPAHMVRRFAFLRMVRKREIEARARASMAVR